MNELSLDLPKKNDFNILDLRIECNISGGGLVSGWKMPGYQNPIKEMVLEILDWGARAKEGSNRG